MCEPVDWIRVAPDRTNGKFFWTCCKPSGSIRSGKLLDNHRFFSTFTNRINQLFCNGHALCFLLGTVYTYLITYISDILVKFRDFLLIQCRMMSPIIVLKMSRLNITWSLTLREERKLRVSENRVLKKVFRPKRDEVTEEWRYYIKRS